MHILRTQGIEEDEDIGVGGWRMQAYDKKRKRIVNVEREENGVVIAYSLPEEPGIWYFPLIENGKNVEPYEIMQNEQMSMFGGI